MQPINMVMTGGWFMTLFYTLYPVHKKEPIYISQHISVYVYYIIYIYTCYVYAMSISIVGTYVLYRIGSSIYVYCYVYRYNERYNRDIIIYVILTGYATYINQQSGTLLFGS